MHPGPFLIRATCALALLLASCSGKDFDWRASATCPTSGAQDPVVNDNDPAGIDCEAPAAAKTEVHGTVKGEGGEPVSEGGISFVPDDPADIGYGFENGRYSILLLPGLYRVTLDASGYEEVTKAVEVERGDPVRIDFVLPRDTNEPTPPVHRLRYGASYWAVYYQVIEGNWEDNRFASGYVGAYPIVRDIDCDDDARAALEVESKKPFTVVVNYFLDERSAELSAAPQDGEPQLEFARVKVSGGRACPLQGDY